MTVFDDLNSILSLLLGISVAISAGLLWSVQRLRRSAQSDKQVLQELNHEQQMRAAEFAATQNELEHRHAEFERLSEAREKIAEELRLLREHSHAVERSRDTLSAEVRAHERSREELEQRIASIQEELNAVRLRLESEQAAHRNVLEKHSALNASLEERDRQHKQQLALFGEQKAVLEKEFENLANRIFEEKGKSFSSSSKESLEQLLKPFREQITEFRTRVDGIHKENNESTVSLRKELEYLRKLNQDMTTDAKNLTEALKGDKKKVGSWGEVQLERTLQLAGLVKGDHYETQAHFKDEHGKNNYPDFVVNLPDQKHIVIDSKVSLIDYDSAISAETEEATLAALDAHVRAVKNHIDGLASKDYSNLIGMRSPSFVLMFMPIEPAYIEVMKHSREIFNYGYQKGVILVSHTTLMPILRTVANLWMIERSNTEAREISDRAGDVYNQVCLLAERLQKLGGTLLTAGKQYNQTVVALSGQQGLHGKVERFSKLSNKITRTMPELEPMHADIELERLEVIRESGSDYDASAEPEKASSEGAAEGHTAEAPQKEPTQKVN